MSGGGGGDHYKDVRFLILILIIIWIMWFVTGGVQRVREQGAGAFINPPSPLDTGGTYGPDAVADNNSARFTPPNTWKRYDTTYFSLYTPPDFEFVELNGVNSYVGKLTNGTVTYTFDFSTYAAPLTREGDSRYTVSYEEIDDYESTLVRPKTIDGTISGIYIDRTPRESFVLQGENLSSDSVDTLLNIGRTVNFR